MLSRSSPPTPSHNRPHHDDHQVRLRHRPTAAPGRPWPQRTEQTAGSSAIESSRVTGAIESSRVTGAVTERHDWHRSPSSLPSRAIRSTPSEISRSGPADSSQLTISQSGRWIRELGTVGHQQLGRRVVRSADKTTAPVVAQRSAAGSHGLPGAARLAQRRSNIREGHNPRASARGASQWRSGCGRSCSVQMVLPVDV